MITYLKMLVQAVGISILELHVALIPGGGLGLLHRWKAKIMTLWQGTLKHMSKTRHSVFLSFPIYLIIRVIRGDFTCLLVEQPRSSASPSRIHDELPPIHKTPLIFLVLNNSRCIQRWSVNARIAGLGHNRGTCCHLDAISPETYTFKGGRYGSPRVTQRHNHKYRFCCDSSFLE